MEPAEELRETEIHLKDYLRVVVKRKWVVLAVFVAVVTTVAIATFRQRPVFQATAQLQIEKENPNILSIKEVMELDASNADYYQTQYRILQSRTLAQAVIDKLGLAAHPEFVPSGTAAGGGAAGAAASALVDAFLARITIEPLRTTRLVNVRARAFDPQLSARMANALVELYIEQNTRQKVDTTQQAGAWLSEQATEARSKLEQSERALQQFNERNNVISLEERQSLLVQKLEELNSEITKARTARIELETRAQQLAAMRKAGGGVEGLESMSEVIASPVIQGMKTELGRLEAELADAAKVYTPKHPKIVALNTQIPALRQRIASEINRVAQSIRNEYEVALKREQSLTEALEQQKRQVQEMNQLAISDRALKREVENNRRIFDVLMSREKETGLVGGMRTSNIRIVDRAEVPRDPVSPRKARNLALALIVGLVGGLGLAFFLEYLDDTVRDPDDLERYVRVPFLGPVPVLEPKVPGDRSRDLLSLQEPKSVYAEAYRAVRTSLLFSSPDNPPRVIMLTSPGPQEGKSLTAINLAVTMALTGNRVLLVDADLRKPRLHKTFGIDNAHGLSSLIGGDSDVGRALHRTEVPSLMVMTSGPIPPNPSELIGSARMGKLLELLRGKFDRILIDCTPLIAVTDATVLAARVDGVILVIKAGATGRRILQRGVRQLHDVQARIVGAVLNQIDARKSTYYYSSYYYSHYYGEEKPAGKSRKGASPAAT
jgi:capsular exopolysaccharide synthesis family protein